MGKKVRIAIAGCGVIGRLHAQQMKLVERTGVAELAAFADTSPEKAESFAAEFGGRAYPTYEALLASPDIDAVSICTPSGVHASMGIQAARAGKHVIVEKPMDVLLERADELIQVCREEGVKLGCIFQHRFDASTQELKADLADGRFGRIVLVNGHVHWYRSEAYYASGDWRGTWAMDGGGALMNQAIHTMDLLQYIGGPVTELHAFTRNVTHPQIEVEDTVAASLLYASGAAGTFSATTSAYPGLTVRIEVIGERGACVVENTKVIYKHVMAEGDSGTHGLPYPQSNQVAERKDEEEEGVSHRVYGHTHYHQLLDFAEAIRDDREPFVNGEEGRKALELVLAVYESGRTGKRIRLNKEISAGGVVFRRQGSGLEIQLIEDRFGKMTLAKGKMEPSETIEQTAIREILEETGIQGRIVEPLEQVEYRFESPNKGLVNKEVHYFLVEASSGELAAQVEEIAGVMWLSPQEAYRRQQQSGYRNNDSVLSRALELLGVEMKEVQ